MVERRISAVDRFRFDCDIVVDGIRRREYRRTEELIVRFRRILSRFDIFAFQFKSRRN